MGEGRNLFWDAVAGQAPMQNASVAVKATDFLRPAAPGRMRGHGRVVRRDADIAFLEAELDDANGATVAKASATARVVEMDCAGVSSQAANRRAPSGPGSAGSGSPQTAAWSVPAAVCAVASRLARRLSTLAVA
jgi:hypothetical protein